MIFFLFHEYDLTVTYHVFRPYLSMIDPTRDTIYTSTIEDGGDNPRVSNVIHFDPFGYPLL